MAGIDLVTKITEETKATSDQEHVPFLLYSHPSRIPDRTRFLLGRTSADPAAPIAEALGSMATAGVTVAAVACNTAHADPIDRAVRKRLFVSGEELQLLHLIDETVQFIASTYPEAGTVGILGTQGTYRFRLYESRLVKAGYKCLIPPPDVRTGKLHDAIYHPDYGIKSNARQISDQSRNDIRMVARRLVDSGADVVILGCTELPLAVTATNIAGAPLVDPARAMARALIHATYPDRLRPWAVHAAEPQTLS